MAKIWIDVTTTMSWNRAAVGIVRVEQELIKHSLITEKDFGYFVFHSGAFEVIPKSMVERKVQPIKENKVIEVKPEIAKKSKIVFNRARFKDAIYSLLNGIFDFFASFIDQETYLKLRHTLRLKFRSLKRTLRKVLKKQMIEEQPKNIDYRDMKALTEIFNDGDVLVSIGLSWDHGEKFDSFYHMKKVKDIKVVSMCYDLIPIKHPNLTVSWENSAKFEHNYVNMTWASDLVLSISKHSKLDYQNWINEHFLPEPKIEVIALGSTINQYDTEKVSEHIRLLVENSKYILFVSTIERRKNHDTIIKAIQYLIDQNSEYIPKVVFVGMKGWGVDDFFNDFELNSRLHPYISMQHGVNDDDLSYLYENCEFFIYPSFYEGWGLPIAEGLTYGKFGLSSNTSSMPEVGQGLLDYLYPFDVIGWASKIEYYIKNPDELKRREKNVKDHFVEYTWESFSNKVFQHIEDDLNI